MKKFTQIVCDFHSMCDEVAHIFIKETNVQTAPVKVAVYVGGYVFVAGTAVLASTIPFPKK